MFFPESFEQAVKTVFRFEGEYANHASDSGGETKYGISKKCYPDLDIENLTLDNAKSIYFRDYWSKSKCDQIADKDVAERFFLLSVNVGVSQATKIVQRALRQVGKDIKADGFVGSQTLNALNTTTSEVFIQAIRNEITEFYKSLAEKHPELKVFLNGWLLRAIF